MYSEIYYLYFKFNTKMNKPKVISVKRPSLLKLGYKNLEDWLKNPNNVYIGRDMTKGAVGSKWQNPFPVQKYGLEKCLELFENHLMNNPKLLSEIHELKGKNLGCWCKNEGHEPCHGDFLLKLANKT